MFEIAQRTATIKSQTNTSTVQSPLQLVRDAPESRQQKQVLNAYTLSSNEVPQPQSHMSYQEPAQRRTYGGSSVNDASTPAKKEMSVISSNHFQQREHRKSIDDEEFRILKEKIKEYKNQARNKETFGQQEQFIKT